MHTYAKYACYIFIQKTTMFIKKSSNSSFASVGKL